MFKNILLFATLILFTGCFEKEEESWSAFIYPDKQNNKRFLILKEKSTHLEACKTLASAYLKEKNILLGNTKCGLHCIYNENLQSNICEEMK